MPQQCLTYSLVKYTSSEKRNQIWKVCIEKIGSNETSLTCTWGYENGKMQTSHRVYQQGKVNRNSWQQATLECRKMMKDKIRKGYIGLPKDLSCKDLNIEETNEENNAIQIPHVMLAHQMEKYPSFYDETQKGAYIMPKLDGIFCLANLSSGKLWSRQRIPLTGMSHIETAVKSLNINKYTSDAPAPEWIVGELYCHGMPFQKITGLVRRSKHNLDDEDIKKIQFHVFDAIMTENSFCTRYSFLKQVIPSCDSIIKLVEATYVVSLKECYKEFHRKYTDMGYEGIIIHPDEGPGYQENKRTKWLLKYKTFQQEEFRCVEVLPLKHKLSAGSVLLEDSKGYRFSATPKCSDLEKEDMWNRRNEYVGQLATVQFFCKTDDKKVPRFPILLGFRHEHDI